MFNVLSSKQSGVDIVGIKDRTGMEVLYYKKVPFKSVNRPVNMDSIYILLDDHGRLWVATNINTVEVIIKDRTETLINHINKVSFGLKGGGKKYYPYNNHGFITNYDQYNNMTARVHYKYDEVGNPKNPTVILFNPIEIAFFRNKQLQQIKIRKENSNGYRKGNNL